MTITIETVAKASKTDLVDYALARGLVRTKTEGSKLLKDALVCLISDKLATEAAAAVQQVQDAPRTREECCGTEAPANGLPATVQREKNTKPPLTAAQRAAKRKKNRIKHRRALGRRRH